MSLHRRAAKRDAAEPAIVKTLEAHGCIVWRVSGKGLADLVVFCRRARNEDGFGTRRHTFVADVKGPKEKATPAQEEKWGALTALGFSVFILRTPEDAVKMLNNALQSWEPEVLTPLPNGGHLRSPPRSGAKEGRKDCVEVVPPRKGDAAKEQGQGRKRLGMGHAVEPLVEMTPAERRKVSVNYTPPRSKPVAHRSDCAQAYHKDDREPCTCGALDAAKEAEAFAPDATVADDCGCRREQPCALHSHYVGAGEA